LAEDTHNTTHTRAPAAAAAAFCGCICGIALTCLMVMLVMVMLVVLVVQVEHAGVEKVLEVDRYNDRVSINLEKHKDHQKAAMAANYIDRETQRESPCSASYCAASLHRLRLISLPDLGACACVRVCVQG
jgi:hypothetical protein